MKKVILSASALMLILVSCQKQDTTPAKEGKSDLKKTGGIIHLDDHEDDLPMRLYFDNGGPNPWDYGCLDKAGNCAPQDVVITAPKITDMVMTLDHNKANITVFVQQNRDVLGHSIPVEYLDKVINGNLQLSMRGDLNAAYRCILFKDNKEAVIYALPVVK